MEQQWPDGFPEESRRGEIVRLWDVPGGAQANLVFDKPDRLLVIRDPKCSGGCIVWAWFEERQRWFANCAERFAVLMLLDEAK